MDWGTKKNHTKKVLIISQVLLLVIAGLASLTITESGTASGLILHVGSGSTYQSIGSALENATSGDRILVEPGTYSENLTIPSGVSVFGNDTDTTIIDPDADVAVHMTGSNSALGNVKVQGGSILVSGNSHDLMNIIADSSDHVALRIEGSNRVAIHNLTVRTPTTNCIEITNSINITFTELHVSGAEEGIMKVQDSMEITLRSCSLNLRDDAVGFSGKNLTTVIIRHVELSDSGESNSGIEIFNITDLRMEDSTFNISGTGISIDLGHSISFMNDLVEVEGSNGVGLDLDTCSNVSLAYFSLNVLEGDRGIESMLISNFTIENGTFRLEEPDSIAIRGRGIKNLLIKDCNGITMGSGSTLVSMRDSDRLMIRNNIISLAAISAKGILLDSSTNSTIGTNYFSSSRPDCMTSGIGSGSQNVFFIDNRIDTFQDRSLGLYVAGSRSITIRDNDLDISGERSQGYLVLNSDVHFSGDDITSSSPNTTGINCSGSSILVNGTILTATGPDSVNLHLGTMVSAVVENSEIYGTSSGARGIFSEGRASRLEIVSSLLDMNGESGHAIEADMPEGHLGITTSVLTSTAPEVPLFIGSGSAFVNTSQITSVLGDVIFIDTPDATIVNSHLSGSIPVTCINSTAMLDTVVLNHTAYSLAAVDNSRIELLDIAMSSPTIGPGSMILVRNRISFMVLDRDGDPFKGVDLRIENFDTDVYSTEYFNSSRLDPQTDETGSIPVQVLLHEYYPGTPVPVRGETEIEVYSTGSSELPWSEVVAVDTSYPHMRVLTSPDIDLPGTPSNFSIRQTDTMETLFLNWNPNNDDTIEYFIHSLDPDSGITGIAIKVPGNVTSWMTWDLGPSKKMFYWITAWDGTWESPPSEIRSQTTKDLTPPLPPSELLFINSTRDSITIRWVHQGAPDLNGFSVFINDPSKGIDFELLDNVNAGSRSYTASGLDWGSTYRFKVQAFDDFDNHSPFGPVLSASTLLPRIELTISAYFGSEGPMAEMIASNCTVELRGFNGTLLFASMTDGSGNASLSGLDAGETYEVRVLAPAGLRGVEGLTTGYLPASSGQVVTDPFNETIHLELTLEYYVRIVNGSIRVRVEYGEGPRSGPVYQATVRMMDEDGNVKDTLETVFDGTVDFIVRDLPFRGRFEVTPPEGVKGDHELGRSGYLPRTTNFFEITFENPDQDFGSVVLDHYLYEQPPKDLEIFSWSPIGSAIDLDAPIRITFDQPVLTSSVIDSFLITPALSEPAFAWSDDNTTLTLTHSGLMADTEYTVLIGTGAISEDGTYFPQGYTNNTWSFRTTALPGEGSPNNSRYAMYGIFAVTIIIIIIILVYSRISSNKVDTGRPPFGDYDEEEGDLGDEYFDEEYPDDIAEQMGEDMEFEDGEYLDDEEEFLEDEEEAFPEEEYQELEETLEDVAGEEEPVGQKEPGAGEETEEEEPVSSDEIEEEAAEERPKKKKKSKKKKKRR